MTRDKKCESSKNSKVSTKQKLAMTAGAMAALMPATTDADIVYVEGQPVTLSAYDGQGAVANWDVDGVNGADFQLWVRSSVFNSSFYNSSNSFSYFSNFYGIVNLASRSYTGGLQMNGRGLVGAGGVAASALFKSFNVGPTLSGGYQWGLSNVSYRSAIRAYSYFRSNQNGTYGASITGVGIDFNNFGQGANFLGFRFDNAGNTHYGWAEVVIAGGDLTISRWVYESDPDTAVHVGTIPEPGSLALLGMGATGVLAMRRRKQEAE